LSLVADARSILFNPLDDLLNPDDLMTLLTSAVAIYSLKGFERKGEMNHIFGK